MERQESSTEIFEKFTWKIENFSRLNADKICSEPFILCGYPWRIRLHPKGNKNKDVVDHLSIYLEAMQTANMSEGWRRDVKFKLIVFNQIDTNGTITQECEHDYIAKEVSCGFRYFMSLTDLRNPQKGFIVKDACIVGAEVFVSNSNRKKQENQEVKLTASPVSNEPTKKVDAELGYTALGRVIILLQTSKVKDMNEQACKELQVLWDELKKFKFDLTWIEPQVQCALGMKRYVEKALQVEKLKEDMVVLKEKLSAAELNLDIERDLLKAEGIKERDLDSEFGYWIWRP
ncbi:unnamed protein product [Trifolium pratense]|uniref:Uncharacterized protein n=1 Tax=Trifolium pratense TaxID=57577 RepID=A0ACB0IJE2_TRIPR|nr:unnamed protein product [Trifolium pratense]